MLRYYSNLYTARIDYAMSSPLVVNLTIPAGSRSVPFSVDIIDDMIQEGNEMFNIVLKSNCSFQSTVIIIDNDGT